MFRKHFHFFFSMAVLCGLAVLGLPQLADAAVGVRGGYEAKAKGAKGADGFSDSLQWSMAGTNVFRDTLVAADNDTTVSIEIAGARRLSVLFTKRDVQGTAGGGCSLRVIPQISNDNINWVDLNHPAVVFASFTTGQTTAAGIGRYHIPLLNLDVGTDTVAVDTIMSGAVAAAAAVTVTNKASGVEWASMQIATARLLRFRSVVLQGNNDGTPYTGGTLDTMFVNGVYHISYQ